MRKRLKSDMYLAGQADSRLLVTIAAIATARPVWIVAFGGSGPGADAHTPLRSADLAFPAHAGGSALVQHMIAFLNAQRPPFRPVRAEMALLPGGQHMLRVVFAAPSPLGLLGPLHL